MSEPNTAWRYPSRASLAFLLSCSLVAAAWADEGSETIGVESSVTLPAQAKGKPPSWAGKAFRQGVVTAGNPYGAEAGALILEQGGNAIDAAVAIAYALNVVEPQSAGIGGGGFMLIHLARTGQTFAIDTREKAPAGATPDMFSGVPRASNPSCKGWPSGCRAWCAARRWRWRSTATCRSRRCCTRRSSLRMRGSPQRHAIRQ